MTGSESGQHPKGPRLPTSLIVAIAALGVVTVFVLIVLFVGDVPERGGRIIATILYFAAFVGTLIGALSIGERDRRFPVPLAIVASVYVVAFGAVLIWVQSTGRASSGNGVGIAVLILVPLWIVVMLPVLLAWLGVRLSQEEPPLLLLGLFASILFGLEAILTFLPVLLSESFGLSVSSFYWRVVTAIWIVAVALVAVYALLLWFYRTKSEVRADNGRAVRQGTRPQSPPVEPLPWPVAEDGLTPLPAGVDGLPVFAVLRRFDGRAVPVRQGDPEAQAAIERGRAVAGRYPR